MHRKYSIRMKKEVIYVYELWSSLGDAYNAYISGGSWDVCKYFFYTGKEGPKYL